MSGCIRAKDAATVPEGTDHVVVALGGAGP